MLRATREWSMIANTTTVAMATMTTQTYVVVIDRIGMTALAIAACVDNKVIYRGHIRLPYTCRKYSLCSVFFATGLNLSCSVVNATFVAIVIKLQATLPR